MPEEEAYLVRDTEARTISPVSHTRFKNAIHSDYTTLDTSLISDHLDPHPHITDWLAGSYWIGYQNAVAIGWLDEDLWENTNKLLTTIQTVGQILADKISFVGTRCTDRYNELKKKIEALEATQPMRREELEALIYEMVDKKVTAIKEHLVLYIEQQVEEMAKRYEATLSNLRDRILMLEAIADHYRNYHHVLEARVFPKIWSLIKKLLGISAVALVVDKPIPKMTLDLTTDKWFDDYSDETTEYVVKEDPEYEDYETVDKEYKAGLEAATATVLGMKDGKFLEEMKGVPDTTKYILDIIEKKAEELRKKP